MSGGKTEIVSGKAKIINPVAEDYNWRLNVKNELKSVDQWNEDWGFLVQGGKLQIFFYKSDFKRLYIDGTSMLSAKPLTKEEQIRQLEEKLMEQKAKSFTKTSSAYGNGDTLEMFSMKHLNRTKNADLMPCPRRPPKKKAAAE